MIQAATEPSVGADFDTLQREPFGSDALLDAVERLDDAGCGAMVDAELGRRESGEHQRVKYKKRGWIGPVARAERCREPGSNWSADVAEIQDQGGGSGFW